MPNYICDKCNKEFNKLTNFQIHIASNNGCDIFNNKTIECDLCDSKFTSLKGLKNHNKNIHNAPKYNGTQTINTLINDNIKLKEKVEELKNIIDKNKKKPGRPKKQISTNIIGNHNTNNTTNNTTNIDKQQVTNINKQVTNINKQEINQNIVIVDYGHEDIAKFSYDEKKSILNSKYDIIRKCTEIMHCNPNHPEYRNISISNLRANVGYVYTRGKYRVRSKDGLLEDLIRDKANNIQEILDEENIVITKATRDKITHLLSLINDNDDEQIKILKKELEYLLYEENKNIVK